MGSLIIDKPHALCLPLPFQSHINAMMQVAKLLHSKGFVITFVNTEYNHRRIVKSRTADSIEGSDEFRFETIPDGLDSSDEDNEQDIRELCASVWINCPTSFRDLAKKLSESSGMPRVTCVISDGFMSSSALPAAEEFGMPAVLFWSIPACSFMGFLQLPELIKRGIIPSEDESFLSNGYLDTVIDWIPGMRGIRLRDLPGGTGIKDVEDPMIKYVIEETQNSFKGSANVFNTFEELEQEVLSALGSMLNRVYAIGPLSLQCRKLTNSLLKSVKTNLWKEERECLEWLDKRDTASVIYVNFGSLAVLTSEQFNEFAWGLANSNHPFLWINRPNAATKGRPVMPDDFVKKIEGRGLLASWCPQEEVLSHSSVGWFLTHCGWNSIMESICGGVPMICRPMFGDQHTNCHYTCSEWQISIEIGNDIKREEIEGVIREAMEGEKAKEMRMKAMKWKQRAENATKAEGSSHTNLDRLIHDVLDNKK